MRKPRSPATRAKIAAALRGKPKSAEHRANLAAAAKGRVLSPATRQKVGAASAQRAPWHPTAKGLENIQRAAKEPERRRKIAAAKRLYWQSWREARNGG